jgi:O-antigen ligase
MCIAAVVTIPLIVDPFGYDPFRAPQAAAFMFFATAAGALLAIGLLRGSISPDAFRRKGPALWCAAAIALWTSFTTLLSSNPTLSRDAAVITFASIALYGAMVVSAREMRIRAAFALLVPGTANAVLLLLQHLDVWNFRRVIESEEGGRRLLTAFIGEANGVGAYLLPAIVCALSGAAAGRSWRRFLCLALAALMAAAVVVTLTITAMLGLVAVLVSFALTALAAQARGRRTILVGATLVAVTMGALMLLAPAVKERVVERARWLGSGEVNRALSGRLTAYETALQMFRRHPLTGVGPGAFKYNFFEFKVELVRSRPAIAEQTQNFAEVHNDHLQLLAETGIVGYALFFACNGLIVALALRRPAADDRARFVRFAAVPAVTALLFSGLAYFPLELTATRLSYLFLFALCTAWSPDWSEE